MSGDDDARTERTRSTDRYHFFQGGPDSEEEPEEEPEENDLVGTNHQSLPPADRWPDPPADDPYNRLPTSYRIWSRTLRTLQRWRDRGTYTPIPEEGGSSSVRQDFLLDTTPIIVDKVARHDERLDMMEDVIMDMPGMEAHGELQQRMDDAEDNISSVNDNTQSLKAKIDSMTWEFKNMKASVEHMERQMGDCYTMTAAAQGITGDSLREFFGKDKK